PGQGSHQFGALKLDVESGWTNSAIQLPRNLSCVVRLRASSAIAWTNTSTLTVENWQGSVFGGGLHQIIFGASATALTTQQLSHFFFLDPACFSSGLYTAAILSNGEIIPNGPPPTGRVPPTLRLASQLDGTIRITLLGEAGSDYGIDVST